jgi:hypothetical protein
MSGFLQNLALRESGAAAVLAPRVTGWFEAPAAHAPGPLPLAEPERHAPAISAPPLAAPPPAVQRRADAPDPAPIAPSQPVPALPASLHARQAAPAPPDPPPREGRHTAAPPLAATARIIAAAAPLASPVPRSAALPPARDDTPAPPMRGTPAEPPAASPRKHAQAELALRPPLPAMAARSPRLAPGALQAAQAGAGRRAGPDAPAQPVIQVTIGRLEVRAVQPSRTAPAARPRQSPTSLDDYLAQRNGAGRR